MRLLWKPIHFKYRKEISHCYRSATLTTMMIRYPSLSPVSPQCSAAVRSVFGQQRIQTVTASALSCCWNTGNIRIPELTLRPPPDTCRGGGRINLLINVRREKLFYFVSPFIPPRPAAPRRRQMATLDWGAMRNTDGRTRSSHSLGTPTNI